MKTPFTADQFFAVFENYNLAVFPAQLLLYLLSFIVIYFVFRPNLKSGKFISGLLAFFWIWMAIVYHFCFFASINEAAVIFGSVFLLQAVLFLFYGVFANKLSFSFQNNLFGFTGVVMILFALVIYPIAGYFFGHVYPSAPTFGLPCPTTIFTFGVLLLIDKKCPVAILIIPVLWSFIGFTAALNFGVWEDTGLLISGILSGFLMFFRNRKFQVVN